MPRLRAGRWERRFLLAATDPRRPLTAPRRPGGARGREPRRRRPVTQGTRGRVGLGDIVGAHARRRLPGDPAAGAPAQPQPALSSLCRKVEPEGAPVPPSAPHAEGPGSSGGKALEDDAGDDTWACDAVGIYLTGIWIQKYLFLKIKTSHLERIVQQVNHLEIPVEQLMLKLNLSEYAHKRTQMEFYSSYSFPKVLFKKKCIQLLKCCPWLFFIRILTKGYFGYGIILSKKEVPWTTENNSDKTLSAPNWNLKYGNSNVEENLTDESDLSENEKANDTLLSYFKKMDLNLKPETIENVEESFTEEPSEVFPYPDFLPFPFNTLDLHKFALSKSENWKAVVDSVESCTEHLITRLLEMERLQHTTIQKERPRLQTTFCTPAVTERPSSSKTIPKMRQPKLSDSVSLQTTCADKTREKRKSNSGSCKLEQSASKLNWSSADKHKWSSRPPSLKGSSTTKQLMATYDDFKNPKSSILNPSQELSTNPTTAQTPQLLIQVVSTRPCVPSRSLMPISPIPLSFPENQRREIKAPRTKKKLYRKHIALNRPFYIQKLNCLSPSFIAKGKCSPIDQK
ncbi:protein FAM217A isoform 3-T3 [Rhynchonycteris naso]